MLKGEWLIKFFVYLSKLPLFQIKFIDWELKLSKLDTQSSLNLLIESWRHFFLFFFDKYGWRHLESNQSPWAMTNKERKRRERVNIINTFSTDLMIFRERIAWEIFTRRFYWSRNVKKVKNCNCGNVGNLGPRKILVFYNVDALKVLNWTRA